MSGREQSNCERNRNERLEEDERVAQGRRDQPIAYGGSSRRGAGQLAFSSTSPEIGSLAQRQTLAARRKRALAA